jgi:glycosyltransferase involved in cell wall biosynthesis
VADGTVFLSESSRTDAQREGLVRSGTPSKVVHCGVDVGAEGFNEARPSGLEADARGFVLCIGATYLHKNRPFALETWAELRRRGWDGQIVLAGPNPPHGNSVTQEAAFALSHPELRGEIRTLGRVSEAEKRWLYQRAALLLYPSTTEGFGLVPFEAARHRVPTLATRHGGLDEVLPDDIPVLTGFDCNQAADDAWLLLHDSSSAEKLCDAILEQAEKYTWAHAATELVAFFEDVLRQPTSRVLSIEGEGFVPIGIGPRLQQNPRRVDGFDAIVRAVIARPGLKRVIAPNGSARQRAVRNGLSAIRRRLL